MAPLLIISCPRGNSTIPSTRQDGDARRAAPRACSLDDRSDDYDDDDCPARVDADADDPAAH
jgi:hypothetical protein